MITLLDFLGALESISWLDERIPTLTLLAVGLIASYIILERRSKLESIHDDLLRGVENLSKTQSDTARFVIDSLQGTEVRSFDSLADCLEYQNERVAAARVQIDDISWSPEWGMGHGLDTQEELDAEYREIITRIAQKIPFREVLIFNRPGRLEKLHKRIRDNWPGYSCAYYPEDTRIPLLQFMIVDNEEVIILSDAYPSNLAIRHPHIVKLFIDYFEDTWQRAQKLKYGKNIYWEEVERVLGESETETLKRSASL